MGWVLIGAHGGAGLTTVAALLNHARPGSAAEFSGSWPTGRRIVLVANSSANGAQAAAQMAANWPLPSSCPALVVVADTPFRAPPLARYRLRAISRLVTAMIAVPYLPAVRNLGIETALQAQTTARTARRLQRRLARVPVDEGQS
ncbi:hypothetical protein OG339_48490 (plasmid) [Streptosporangium sp. NBC_01495]|uniref:DUF6668 family protein n=1 Tax=Streptosporangium sp. NBC_01495 TaxID=2903899 RepID=UPI002E2F059C|nr:DUF6668 family protein [Streptosporangium sp. NBC_01495]